MNIKIAKQNRNQKMNLRNVKLANSYHMLHPRPAILVSAFYKKPNVMTCAWNTPVCDEPAIVAIILGDQSYTAKMIAKSKEFVINIPSRKMLSKVLQIGSVSGKNTDKAKKIGLKYLNSEKIRAPRVEGCLGYLECRLIKHERFSGCNLFVAKVLKAETQAGAFKEHWKVPIPEHLAGKLFSFGRY